MTLITRLLARFEMMRAAAREARLRALAAAKPGFEWLIVKAGTAIKSRSPMLATDEMRDWFREEFPNARIVHVDNDNKIVFYE